MQISKRMVAVCALGLLAVVSLGVAGDASAANLLVNPGFESGDLTGWQVFGVSANSYVTAPSGDNGPSAPGTHNAYMYNVAQAQGLTLKQSTVPGSAIPGLTMYSYDLKLDQANVGGVLFVHMFAEQTGVGIIGDFGLMGPYWPWNAWVAYSGTVMAPAGTDFLTIQFEAVTGAAEGSSCLAHVDNVVFDQGTSPTELTTWGSIKAMYN